MGDIKQIRRHRTGYAGRQINMHTIRCPFCEKEVELVSFGGGWVGLCCGRIVYNSKRLPQEEGNKEDQPLLTVK